MLMFDRIAEQLRQVEQELCSVQLSVASVSARRQSGRQDAREAATNAEEQLQQAMLALRESTAKLSLFNETYGQLHEDRSLESVMDLAMDLIWQKAPISYAAIVLGEAELGPYHYYGMKGVKEAWRYIKKECNFSLSGVLARALLQRLDPSEPDYLYIPDIEECERPLPDEFPWMSRCGTLIIIPLRSENLARGALIIGHSQNYQFDDLILRDEYVDIAGSIASAVRNAQMRQEMAKNIEQLINVQLLTREITYAQHYQDVTDILTNKIPEVIGRVNVQVYMQYPQTGAAGADKSLQTIIVTIENLDISDLPLDIPSEIAEAVFAPYANLFSAETVYSDYVAGAESIESPSQPGKISPEVQQLFQWTMEAAEPVFYDAENLSLNPEHPYYSDSGRGLIVPIIGHSCTYGIIHILSLSPLRRFDESDMVVLRTIANSAATAISSVELIQERKLAEVDAIYKLICSLETDSPDGVCHSQRVAHNAILLARCLGLSPSERRIVGCSAALHNVGILTTTKVGQQWHCGFSLCACPTAEPHHIQALQVDPEIIQVLHLLNVIHKIHDQPYTTSIYMEAERSATRLHHTPHTSAQLVPGFSVSGNGEARNCKEQVPGTLPTARTDTDIVQMSASIISLVDTVDHVCATSVDYPGYFCTEVMNDVMAHLTDRAVYIDQSIVDVVKILLAEGLLRLPLS